MLYPENGYVGTRNKKSEIEVIRMRDGRQEPLHHEVHHSPDGFEWGYSGSGPADLAYSILIDATSDKNLAWELHQAFKRDFIAGIEEDEWVLPMIEVENWLKAWQIQGA